VEDVGFDEASCYGYLRLKQPTPGFPRLKTSLSAFKGKRLLPPFPYPTRRCLVNKKNISKVNILDHVLVPRHRILSTEEKEALLNKYNIKPSQLPKILDSDPVTIAIGAKPGDIVEIVRKSPVAGETLAYRVVVEG
jgi:DNA-directed RNA polymerase subunit H